MLSNIYIYILPDIVNVFSIICTCFFQINWINKNRRSNKKQQESGKDWLGIKLTTLFKRNSLYIFKNKLTLIVSSVQHIVNSFIVDWIGTLW